MSLQPFLSPFVDQAEQSRIRKLCGRIPKDSAVRAACELLLNGFEPPDDSTEACIQAVKSTRISRWRERKAAAWFLGVAPLPARPRAVAAECLARVIDNFDVVTGGAARIKRVAARTGLGLLVVMAFFLLRYPGFRSIPLSLGALAMLGLWIGCPVGSIVWDHRCVNIVRDEAARALGRLGVPQYLAALARGVHDPAAEVRVSATWAFRRTLDQVTPEMEGRLPSNIGATLCGVLHVAESDLAMQILRVLPIVAGAEAISTVERMAAKGKTEELQDAARAILPALYERRDRTRLSERLLRPSAVVAGDPETLLRPMSEVGSSEPELLLRPSADHETT